MVTGFNARSAFTIPSPRKKNDERLLKLYVQLEEASVSELFSYNHGQKSWDTFAFLGRFPVHTGPTPPITPQTMLDACIQNFFRI